LFFPVARIIKPHGVKGEIKLLPIKEVFAPLLVNQKTFYLQENKFKASYIKEYKQGFILKLVGINDMDAAEELRDEELAVDSKIALDYFKEEGIYFTEQWIGYQVIDENDKPVGVIEDILYTGANDVLVVQGASEILVPVVEDFILDVDEESKVVKINTPEYDK